MSENARIVGCDAYSPAMMLEYHSDLFYYGVHGVETLFTIMGTGCQSVTRVFAEGTEVVTGIWKDGRVGNFRGIRDGLLAYGATDASLMGMYRDHLGVLVTESSPAGGSVLTWLTYANAGTVPMRWLGGPVFGFMVQTSMKNLKKRFPLSA